jgi:hypothetical protein
LLIEKSSVVYTAMTEPAAERTTNEEAEIVLKLQINYTTETDFAGSPGHRHDVHDGDAANDTPRLTFLSETNS